MSFSYLPTELKEAIIFDPNLDRETLAVLCLVSRSTLDVARPHLYRDLHVNLQYTKEVQSLQNRVHALVEEDMYVERDEKELQEQIETLLARQIGQDALFTTLEARPEWYLYVKSLQVTIGTKTEKKWALVSNLLPSFTSLRELTVFHANFTESDYGFCAMILRQCPRNLTSLDLVQSALPITSTFRLLEKLPNLQRLSLGYLRSPEDGSSTPRALLSTLDSLRSLTLRFPFRSSSSFAAIANAAPSLTTLEVDFESISALIPSLLSKIRRLVISSSWNPRSSKRLHRAEQLVSVLDRCSSLESFELIGDIWKIHSEKDEELEAQRVLHHLPSSLRHLSFHILYLSPSYYLDFLSNHNTSSLRKLELSRLIDQEVSPPVYDRVTEAKVVEICESRNIILTWVEDREDRIREGES
ncbi:hypothetical protein JCM16303_007213 [Sporobolomyces ruberrimus]